MDQGSSWLTITANPIPRNILSSTPLPGKTFHSVHLVFSKFEQLLGFNVENGPISKSVIDLFQKDFSYWIKITCQSSRGRRWQSFFTVRSISSSVTFLFRHLYRIQCIEYIVYPHIHLYTTGILYQVYTYYTYLKESILSKSLPSSNICVEETTLDVEALLRQIVIKLVSSAPGWTGFTSGNWI